MEVVDLKFKPRAWQTECFRLLLAVRFAVIVAHRRSGKTVLVFIRLLIAALKTPGGRFAYVAPLLRQAKDVGWLLLKHYACKIPGTVVNEAELWVELPNSARIRLYGADNPDSLRGL